MIEPKGIFWLERHCSSKYESFATFSPGEWILVSTGCRCSGEKTIRERGVTSCCAVMCHTLGQLHHRLQNEILVVLSSLCKTTPPGYQSVVVWSNQLTEKLSKFSTSQTWYQKETTYENFWVLYCQFIQKHFLHDHYTTIPNAMAFNIPVEKLCFNKQVLWKASILKALSWLNCKSKVIYYFFCSHKSYCVSINLGWKYQIPGFLKRD